MASRPISVEQALNRVRLPDALDEHIHRTARLTRLRTDERIDIAIALIDRAWSGLAADRAVEEVVRDLGDPKELASRLRAEALAKRSRLDRASMAIFKGAAVAVLLLLAVYAIAATVIWRAQPTITSGPFERLDALATPVAESEAAWPIYRDEFDLNIDGALSRAEREFADAVRFGEGTSARREAAIERLRLHRADADRLREAAALPGLGLTMASSDVEVQATAFFTMTMESSHHGPLRVASRFLAADAQLAALDGDGGRAVDDLVALLSIARQARGHHTLLEQLTASAIFSLQTVATICLLRDHPDAFTDVDLARLLRAFESIDPPFWRYDVRADRLLAEDLAQRLYTDDGNGNGRLLVRRVAPTLGEESGPGPLVGFLIGPVRAFSAPRRRAAIDDVMRLIDLLEADLELVLTDDRMRYAAECERLGGPRWHEWRDTYDPHFPIRSLVPSPSVISSMAYLRNRADAAMVAIALERWRRAHGAWPTELAQLVPEFLASVPSDAFDGDPLRYRLDASGPRLWTAGTWGFTDFTPIEQELVLIGDGVN